MTDADEVIDDVVPRWRMRAENLRHRSTAIVVLSTDGRLLVHRRADTKDLLPGWWDVCAGGVVTFGETYDESAARELAEELGVVGVTLQPGFRHLAERLRCDPVKVEFTVEPFVEATRGAHVTAPVDALGEMGVDVEIGPFGSSCEVDAERVGDVVGAIVRAAIDHGATHVNVDVAAEGG